MMRKKLYIGMGKYIIYFIYFHMWEYIFVRLCKYIYIYIYVCVCVCVCV